MHSAVLHLDDVLEQSPRGSHEQEQDSKAVGSALSLPEGATETAGVVGVLEQQVGTDQERDDVGDDVAPHVDDRLGGGDNQQDEGDGELQVTIDELGELLGEEETDHHSNEGDPCTNSSPQVTKQGLRELKCKIGYQKRGQQIRSPVGSVQDQQVDGSEDSEPSQESSEGSVEPNGGREVHAQVGERDPQSVPVLVQGHGCRARLRHI